MTDFGLFPYNWYWLADDRRLFSSARQVIVADTDPDYIAWLAIPGNYATPWPPNDAGAQTDAALQDVLTQYGIFVNLAYYTANARWRRQQTDLVVNGLPFATDPVTMGSLNSAYIYTIDKQSNEFSWKLPDGTFITLDTAGITDLQAAVSSYGQACFQCEDDTLTAIEAGTITTREQVDAAFAAVSNVFTSAMRSTPVVRHKSK